jgi:hypothetical protein
MQRKSATASAGPAKKVRFVLKDRHNPEATFREWMVVWKEPREGQIRVTERTLWHLEALHTDLMEVVLARSR